MNQGKKLKVSLWWVLVLFLILLGVAVALAAEVPKMGTKKIPRNSPVPATAASIAAGAKLFTANCIGCHGLRADGNGVVARNLDPRPRNLRNYLWIQAKPDGYLFRSITYGVPGTSMPSWGPVLSENDRWNLINYLRSLSSPPKLPPIVPPAKTGAPGG